MLEFLKKYFPVDKMYHLAAGWVVYVMLSIFVGPAGIFGSLLAGWGKEMYDQRHPNTHTYDKRDMYYTWAGGVLAMAHAYLTYYFTVSGHYGHMLITTLSAWLK